MAARLLHQPRDGGVGQLGPRLVTTGPTAGPASASEEGGLGRIGGYQWSVQAGCSHALCAAISARSVATVVTLAEKLAVSWPPRNRWNQGRCVTAGQGGGAGFGVGVGKGRKLCVSWLAGGCRCAGGWKAAGNLALPRQGNCIRGQLPTGLRRPNRSPTAQAAWQAAGQAGGGLPHLPCPGPAPASRQTGPR